MSCQESIVGRKLHICNLIAARPRISFQLDSRQLAVSLTRQCTACKLDEPLCETPNLYETLHPITAISITTLALRGSRFE